MEDNAMKRHIGLIGEELAANHIKNEGYNILERNYRTKLGELDIIARDQNIIIFIEVKTRTSGAYGMPSEAVNYKKQQTIRKLSQQYIRHKKLDNSCLDYRFDVIEVKLVGRKYKIDHMENAF